MRSDRRWGRSLVVVGGDGVEVAEDVLEDVGDRGRAGSLLAAAERVGHLRPGLLDRLPPEPAAGDAGREKVLHLLGLPPELLVLLPEVEEDGGTGQYRQVSGVLGNTRARHVGAREDRGQGRPLAAAPSASPVSAAGWGNVPGM
jgi:hypothetical protein